MEALALGFILGAGVVYLGRRGRSGAKAAVGWAARQSGWMAARIRADVESARNFAREEFQQARSAPAAVVIEDPIPSQRIDTNGGARHEASASIGGVGGAAL